MDITDDENIPTETSFYEAEKGDIDPNIQIEVLKQKIKVDEKQHQNEKEEMKSEMNQVEKHWKFKNEILSIELDNKEDKIRELTRANSKSNSLVKKLNWEKDQLKQKGEELEKQISLREETIREMSITYQGTMSALEKKQEEMRKEIVSLKEELELVKREKENKNEELLSYMIMIGSKIEDMDREAKEGRKQLKQEMEEREKDAQRREKLREDYWTRKEAKREEEEKKREQRFNNKLQHYFSGYGKGKESKNPQKGRVIVKEAQNLQVGGGNNIYYRQTPRWQQDTSHRGNVQPPTRISVPNGNAQPPCKKGTNERFANYKN